MWKHYNRTKQLEPLFYVFILTKAGRIGEYPVLEVGETEYLCVSPFVNQTFIVKISKTFKTRDDLKYNNFRVKMDERKRPQRIRALTTTKQLEYKKRYLNEYPEKAI